MKIRVGEKIKMLRNNKELTQEQLAEIFDVSPQAISRWENNITYPDINLLPSIAYFFRISTDELLGMDELRNEEEISKIHNEIHKKVQEEKFDLAINDLRDALKEYPRDYGFMCELALVLTIYREDKVSLKDLNKAISLSEIILDECINDKIRNTTKANLCFLYQRAGMETKAYELGRTLPHAWESREVLMPEILELKEDDKIMKEGIITLINIIYSKINRIEDKDKIIKELILGLREFDSINLKDKMKMINQYIERVFNLEK